MRKPVKKKKTTKTFLGIPIIFDPDHVGPPLMINKKYYDGFKKKKSVKKKNKED